VSGIVSYRLNDCLIIVKGIKNARAFLQRLYW
jgi:hypothetical protein